MSRKKVLMACPNYWSSPFQVGSHHIARGFVAAGWDVAFISDPISPFHVLRGITEELRERFATYRGGGQWQMGGRVWTYVPGSLVAPQNKPILRSEWVHRHWAAWSFPNVSRLAARRGFGEVDLLYFDSVPQRFWLDAVKYRKSVLRIADNPTGFARHTAAMQVLERELAGAVDAVVYTAANLREYVAELSPRRAFHLPNGVNFDHFANDARPRPPEYEHLSGPVAVYVGAMDVWFDFPLINQAAKALPDVQFVLIGPDRLARTRLESLPNLHLLGRRPYDLLPAYLRWAHVGIIPFDVAGHPKLINSINPLKLYEYLACGLPVVAVEWEELRNLASPAVLCSTPERFIEAIQNSVTRSHDTAAYLRYAAAADWRSRVLDLTEQLDL